MLSCIPQPYSHHVFPTPPPLKSAGKIILYDVEKKEVRIPIRYSGLCYLFTDGAHDTDGNEPMVSAFRPCQLTLLDARLSAPRIWFPRYTRLYMEHRETTAEYRYQERGLEWCQWCLVGRFY